MHYGNNGAQRYLATDLGTMTPEKMIVLLYERMIRDLRQAKEAVATNKRERMVELVSHSQLIVGELRVALDHTVGGDISRNLDDIYEWLFLEHLNVLADQDPARLDNCIRVIEPLLEAWRQVPTGAAAREAAERGDTPAAGSSGPNPASSYTDNGATAGGESAADAADRNLISISV